MSLLALYCLLGLQLAQPPAPETAPSSEQIRVIAIRAQRTGTVRIDARLESVSARIQRLPFDTFDTISIEERPAPYASETRIPIDAMHSIYVTPQQRLDSGEVELIARLEMLDQGRGVNAIVASTRAAPGKPLVFRGLGLPPGELVVFMSVEQPQDSPQSGASQQDTDDPNESNEPRESGGQPEHTPESGGEEPPDDSAEAEELQEAAEQDGTPSSELADAQSAPMADRETIEAILQSLEEIDRREQAAARSRPEKVQIRGDWW